MPDVQLDETKQSDIAKALVKNDGIFDFVTQYVNKNPNMGEKIPVITDADYSDFKNFLKAKKISFDTETELALKKTLETAKKEKIDDAISSEYNALLSAVQKSEEIQLVKNQKEIKNLMLDEMIKRYQYKEGLYNYYIKNNFEIKKSVAILEDITAYNKILKK